MRSPSVTIIGAGPSGLCLAWWLVNAGHAVTVL
ncbi:MAG: NAD(P)-binding protein, partial [Luminiphilus sp.]